jgi:hypothetical protein
MRSEVLSRIIIYLIAYVLFMYSVFIYEYNAGNLMRRRRTAKHLCRDCWIPISLSNLALSD